MSLTKAAWDAAMTSIGARLREREALEASFQALIDLGVGQAIAAVQNEIGPTAAQAQAYAEQIEDLLNNILLAGVPAALVSTTPSLRFTSDAEMAAKAAASALADLASLVATNAADAAAAIALKAPLASPALTGAPTAPTAAGGTNTTQIATTAFVKAALDALISAAPGALDTLDELAAALGDDANFAATMTTALAARLRFDAAQALSAGEKTQGRSNLGVVSPTAYALLQDQKSSGSNGGTFTSGAWQTRTLNTEVYDPDGLISLASNQFTPSAAGVAEWSAPAIAVNNHQSRLYNVTDGVVTAYGSSERSDSGVGVTSRSVGSAQVVAGKAYRIEHRCETTISTTGFGPAGSFGGTEIYTEVRYRRTA